MDDAWTSTIEVPRGASGFGMNIDVQGVVSAFSSADSAALLAGIPLKATIIAVAGHRDARGVRRGGHLAHELANLGACGVVRGDCDDWGGCIRVWG